MEQPVDPWNLDDAVRSVVNRTGMEEWNARAVLMAKERYLDLAGIGGVKESEALLHEREVHRHLLPDHPNELDDRELEYVRVTTGLDDGTIETIFLAETAYADQIGIIDWPDEAERKRNLGDYYPSPLSDLDRGLEGIRYLFEQKRLTPEVVDRDTDGVVFSFDLGGDRYALHLCVTRWPSERKGFGPIPTLLARVCVEQGARPLQIRVNLRETVDGVFYDYFGLEAFTQEIHTNHARWRNHLLLGVAATEWLARAGGVSTFGIDLKDGCPRVKVGGHVLTLPLGNGRFIENPLVDPIELCRSVMTDDECWIFTCGCGEPGCAGIWSGILVVHSGPYTIWISPERPELPLGVFPKWRYRRTILATIKAMLSRGKSGNVECGVYGVTRKSLKRALNSARRGVPRLHSSRVVLHAPE